MKLHGVCILTGNAPRLAAFYQTVLQETPIQEGQHYRFPKAQLSLYDPGDRSDVKGSNLSLVFSVCNVQAEFNRLREAIPGFDLASPPERRPWGAFSFWVRDPEGNLVSFLESPDPES